MLKEQRNNPETARAGLKWDNDEDKKLLEKVRANVPLADIAKELLRTEGSLKTRLITYALNKVENEMKTALTKTTLKDIMDTE
jgi:DNA-binding IscR family transcriptional regulator